MQLAVSTIAWDPNQDAEATALLTEMGASAVELAPTKYWPAPCRPCAVELAECRRFWNDRGLRIASLQALLFGMPHLKVFGAGDEQLPTLEYLGQVCRLGAALGAGTLVFGSPRNRDRGDRSEAQAVAEALPFFRALAEAAGRVGVAIGLEPNPPQYGCNFLTTAEAVRQFVAEVGHPNLRVHLDTGILALNEEPPEESIDRCLPWLCSLHISEPYLRAVGSGTVDHRRIGRHLRCVGYVGPMSIEMRAQADAAQNLAAVRQALAVVRDAYLAA